MTSLRVDLLLLLLQRTSLDNLQLHLQGFFHQPSGTDPTVVYRIFFHRLLGVNLDTLFACVIHTTIAPWRQGYGYLQHQSSLVSSTYMTLLIHCPVNCFHWKHRFDPSRDRFRHDHGLFSQPAFAFVQSCLFHNAAPYREANPYWLVLLISMSSLL